MPLNLNLDPVATDPGAVRLPRHGAAAASADALHLHRVRQLEVLQLTGQGRYSICSIDVLVKLDRVFTRFSQKSSQLSIQIVPLQDHRADAGAVQPPHRRRQEVPRPSITIPGRNISYRVTILLGNNLPLT